MARTFRLLLTVGLGLMGIAGCSQPLPAQAPTAAPEKLTIAFWNVENLLDEYKDESLRYDEKFSPAAVQERLGKDAEVLRSLNADIVGLAEVENLLLLKRLVSGYLAKDGYRHITLIEGRDPRGIDVALISRFPFLARTVEIEGHPRDILAARFVVRDQPFYVLVNHWKSRRDGDGSRDAELRKNGAVAIQKLLPELAEYEGRPVPVVVVGDFNDEPTDPSVQLLEQAGLFNTMTTVPEPLRWTCGYYDRDASQMNLLCFDQILVSTDLRHKAPLQWTETTVHRPSFMINRRRNFNGVNYPLPLDDYQDRIGYSDHFPVKATFTLRP